MPESILIDAIQALKIVPRTGWIHAGVGMADVESVAEHSYSVVFLSMILSEKLKAAGTQVDLTRTLKMAILHDLSESLTFDISKRYLEFVGETGQQIKRDLEDSANQRLLSELPPSLKKEAKRLLQEHSAGGTIEAKVVTAADRIDLIMQLNAYQRRGFHGPILREMEEKVTAEIKAMKNPIFTAMLRSAHARS